METEERRTEGIAGPAMLLGAIVGFIAGIALIGVGAVTAWPLVIVGVLVVIASGISVGGHVINAPNQARVLTLFGKYNGTISKAGWWWVNPFTIRKKVSLRINNLDSDSLKVNDAMGNPVEIAAVINWQVKNTARAVFDVQNYENFVRVQAEAAIRHVASEYPYDDWGADSGPTLRGNADQVMQTLTDELQSRLDQAGVTVLDSRLRRLAYAPEIAQEMLRRQQASAVVAARHLIVQGAVGMVEHALEMLSERKVVELDEERKAMMVSNLLVVLCSDRGAQPVVNAGTIYQ